MCSRSPSAPEPVAPAAPAPPAPPPPTLDTRAEDDNKKSATGSSARGRASLRIDRTAPMAGGTGSGLNIPK